MADNLDALHARMERLEAELSATDDWAQGVCAALNDVLQVMSHRTPAVLQDLEPRWRERRELYQRANTGDDVGISPDVLQPVSVLYGLLQAGGAWARSGVH